MFDLRRWGCGYCSYEYVHSIYSLGLKISSLATNGANKLKISTKLRSGHVKGQSGMPIDQSIKGKAIALSFALSYSEHSHDRTATILELLRYCKLKLL